MQFAPLYPIIYSILKPIFPNCLWSGETNVPQIALTFDDGPHEQWTPQLLEVLDRYEIRASFFWLGSCVQRCPGIAKSVYERGHGIGLHGYDHRCFPLLSEAEFQQSLAKTHSCDRCRLSLRPRFCATILPKCSTSQWSIYPANVTKVKAMVLSTCDVECGARRLATTWIRCGGFPCPETSSKWIDRCFA